MKKHICSIIAICIALVIGCVNVSASSDKVWVNWEYDIINGEITITHLYAHYSYKLEMIPDEIDGYPVVEIATDTFFPGASNDFYDNIKIPDTVRKIGADAFCGHLGYGFHDITVPKSVTFIGNRALGYSKTYLPPLGCIMIRFEYEKFDDMIIRGYTGTAAETYAKNNGFTFIALDEPDVTTTASTTTTATTETTVTTATTPDITTNIKGDANGDGRLAAGDAAFIAKKLAEASVSGEEITVEKYPDADFNDDGKVTADDAADIAGYLAELVLKNKI